MKGKNYKNCYFVVFVGSLSKDDCDVMKMLF